jgi:hypothetical protein
VADSDDKPKTVVKYRHIRDGRVVSVRGAKVAAEYDAHPNWEPVDE